MKPARDMTDDELAFQLRHFFKSPPPEGLGFTKAFISKVKRGWPITPKMRRKAQFMVDSSYAEAEYGSLIEEGDRDVS